MKRGNNRLILSSLFVIFAISVITKKNDPIPVPLYSEQIPYFSYTDQNGLMFTANNLKNKISVVDFFFTSCQGPCPAMNRYMKELVENFSNKKDLQFVSFSVDPVNDSKTIIKEYTNTGYLDYDNWYFLETEEQSIVDLLENGFKLSSEGLPGAHSIKFILIDNNAKIIGYYDPFENKEFNLIKNHISSLLDMI